MTLQLLAPGRCGNAAANTAIDAGLRPLRIIGIARPMSRFGPCLFPIIVACTACPAAAQGIVNGPRTGALQQAIGNPAALHLSGSFRTRIEFLNDGFRPQFKRDEDLLLTRTTLLAEIGGGPVKFAAELWDSRAWTVSGASAAGTGEVNTLEPVQAFVRVDFGKALGAGSKLAVQGGRMMLNLGSRRLVAADDYRNTTNGYTGLRIDIAPRPDISGNFIFVLPQQRLPDDRAAIRNGRVALDRESFDQQLFGGIIDFHNIIGHNSLDVSGFHLFERDSAGHPTRNRDLTTLSARLLSPARTGGLDYEIEGAWQWGKARATLLNSAPLQTVGAWFVHASAGYRFGGGWQPHLSAAIDVVSGDRPGGKYSRFDTLFGMRRADFSPGSLLSVIGRANLVAPALRLEVTPSKRSEGFVTARALWAESGGDSFSTSGLRDSSGKSGRFGGYEFDSRLRHWLVPGVLRGELNTVFYLRQGLLRNAPLAPAGPTTFYTSASLITIF